MTTLTSEPAIKSDHHPEAQVTILRPRSGWQPVNLRELWNYRELLWFLAMRNVKVRYKQTALGAAWAIIQPLFTMIVFSVFFGNLAGLSAKSTIPYPVLTFCALLPWQLFATSLGNAGNSLVSSQNLITKVYFPRLTIPMAAILAGLIDFAIAFVVLLVMMAFYRMAPHWPILLLPLFVILAVITALAIGLWLSALNVQYRDVRYTIPFLTQFWMFLTPVAYPISIVPHKWQALYAVNPMVGVVEGFKWALLGQGTLPGPMIFVSTAVTVLLLIGGLFYFRRMETTFADVV